MMVTLIETYRIFNMTLPDKVKGRFWITDVDSFGNDRKLISVEADEGSWVLKGSDSAVICDTHNRIADDTVLEDNVFYNVRILEENEEGYVYAQPDDIGRQTFDKYVFRDNAELTIGRDSDNTVCINNRYVSSHHAVIKYMDGVWTIEDKNSTNGTFVNNRRTSLQELRPGDVLFIVGFKLIIGSNYIAFNNPGNTVKWDNNILQNMKPQEFDGVGKTKTTEIRPQFFYRAPRFKRDISTLKFKVDMPPAKEAQNNMPMAMIMGPSITMGMASMSSGAFSVINAINSGGNVMSVIPTAAMSVSMLLGMVMWPIITKKHEKKESQRCEAERQKLYKEYLFSLRDTIRREIENQEQILRENNISIDEASDRIINRLGNLWERNINQDDFLSISLGNGNIQMCEEIQFPDRKFSVNKDNLINDMFALANEPRELKSVPVVHSFKNNKVTGIVGENDRKVKDFVMSLIIKIAALHSYDELKLVFILSEKDDDIVNVVKWFPHTWDDEHVKRYIATNLREAKEISSELEQEFYNRRELRNEDIAAPYYLIISTNKEIAEKTEIYDKVIENSKCNGYSIINVCGKFRMLPKETVSVIEIDDEGSKIYEKNDISGNSIMFEAESGIKCNINDIAVRLANTQLDIASRMYELPDMITFLDMYGVDRIEHLNPLIRWKENNPTVSLSAPVGVDTTGELFTLDLHEKYQGPHGLVAGMTGSGKSEFIITYILSIGYITREGIKYGIFFIVTANNSGAVRFRLAQNFSNIYVMQMNDRDDYTGILGPVEGTYPSKYKGRGIFKTEHTYEFQTAVFSKAEKINECINGLIEKLKEDGIQKAKTIPVLPVKVDCEYLSDHGVTLDKFIVGIDTKTLEPAILNIRDSYITVGIANDIQSLITYGQGMAEIISDKKLAEVIVIDGTGSFYPDETKKYAHFAEGYEEKVVALFNEVLRRHKILKNNENMGDEGQLVYILFGFSKIFDFLSADGKDKLKVALEKGKHELKVNFVLIDEGTSLAKQSMDNWYKVQCGNLSGVWVGDGSSEQYILKITKVRSELYQEMADGLGVYINKGR